MEKEQDMTVAEARANMKARFGEPKKAGNRRIKQSNKKKTVAVVEDKGLNKVVARYDPKPIPEIEEVNMFREDASVLHMRKPTVKYAFKEQLLVLNGNVETKTLKSMMPDILKQVGPKEFGHLTELIQGMQGCAAG